MPVRTSVTPGRAAAVGVATLALCLAGPSAAFALDALPQLETVTRR